MFLLVAVSCLGLLCEISSHKNSLNIGSPCLMSISSVTVQSYHSNEHRDLQLVFKVLIIQHLHSCEQNSGLPAFTTANHHHHHCCPLIFSWLLSSLSASPMGSPSWPHLGNMMWKHPADWQVRTTASSWVLSCTSQVHEKKCLVAKEGSTIEGPGQ